MTQISINDLQSLSDENIKIELELSLKNNDSIDIVLRNKSVFIAINNEFKFKGEFYKKCEELICMKKNLPKICFWEAPHAITNLYKNFTIEAQKFNKIGNLLLTNNKEQIKDWIKKSHVRDKLPQEVKNTIFVLSKQRCQFCGKNLDSHIIHNRIGKGFADYAQIAHIEGAGFDGPRANLNKEDCDNVDNLMLLCYECHREIDFVRPDDFSVEYLKTIKREQQAKVSTLLNSLSYPIVFPLKILAALSPSDQITANNYEIAEALMETGYSIPEEYWKKDLFEVPKSTTHYSSVHESFYWENLFKIIKQDINTINHYFDCSKKHHNSKGVALFCHHGISELILLGRILGDTATVHLYQKHRIINSDFYWTWPNKNDKSGNNDIQFYQKILKKPNLPNTDEALLLIEVSGNIKEENIPTYLYDQGNSNYKIPTLKIESNKVNKEATAISSLDSLSRFRNEVNSAINLLQENWKCNKIHIINLSPTTTNVVIGQSLQDRHHAEIICYEKNKESNIQTPTIGITQTHAYFYNNRNITLLFE
jgi:hypothetical protein